MIRYATAGCALLVLAACGDDPVKSSTGLSHSAIQSIWNKVDVELVSALTAAVEGVTVATAPYHKLDINEAKYSLGETFKSAAGSVDLTGTLEIREAARDVVQRMDVELEWTLSVEHEGRKYDVAGAGTMSGDLIGRADADPLLMRGTLLEKGSFKLLDKSHVYDLKTHYEAEKAVYAGTIDNRPAGGEVAIDLTVPSWLVVKPPPEWTYLGSCEMDIGITACGDYYATGTISASTLRTNCENNGYVFHTNTCSTLERIGTCTVATADALTKARYYSDSNVEYAEAACTNQNGSWEPG